MHNLTKKTRSCSAKSNEELKAFIERIKRLENEKSNIAKDIKLVYEEARSVGFCPKIMRKIIRLPKLRDDKRSEFEHLIENYKRGIDILRESENKYSFLK